MIADLLAEIPPRVLALPLCRPAEHSASAENGLVVVHVSPSGRADFGILSL